MESVTMIFSPYHNGVYEQAVGAGPTFLRKSGIIDTVERLGFSVHCVDIAPVDDLDGDIARAFEIMRRLSSAVAAACAKQSFPIILSGNCNASVGVISGLNLANMCSSTDSYGVASKTSQGLGCVWFDAHDDFNTPDSLVSGYLDSMPVAMLAGQCFRNLCNSIPGFGPLSLDRFCYVGIRDVTPEEKDRVLNHNIAAVWGDEATHQDFSSGLSRILDQRTGQKTYIHLDLDCLDISVGRANKFSAPGGLLEEDLVSCMQLLPERIVPLALTIASFDPSVGDGERIAKTAIAAISAFLRVLKIPSVSGN